jgi:hypothetical protein
VDINNILNSPNVAKYCKFDARGTVAPNTDTVIAPAVETKMASFTGAECARCVFWFEETKSVTYVQRKFRTQYLKEPPSRPTIYSWHKNFVKTACSVCHAKSQMLRSMWQETDCKWNVCRITNGSHIEP